MQCFISMQMILYWPDNYAVTLLSFMHSLFDKLYFPECFCCLCLVGFVFINPRVLLAWGSESIITERSGVLVPHQLWHLVGCSGTLCLHGGIVLALHSLTLHLELSVPSKEEK